MQDDAPGFQPFGTMPDGQPILSADLAADGLEAKIITLGAVVADLTVQLPGESRRVVLGFDHAEPYLHHSPHIGAIAGRFGGRIRDGRVMVDSQTFELSRNGGAHHAHGGHNGFGRRNWQAVEATSDRATLSLHSPDGEEGYPGAVTTQCAVSLADGWLWIELTAQTDAPTPFNPLHHGYFNLDGTGRIAGHRLTIPASTRLEWADDNCPTGRFVPVEDALDFRHPRTPDPAIGYDISYMLDEKPGENPRFAGLVESTSGDLAMEVWTTEPGLHFYDGFKLDVPVPGHGRVAYKPRYGLCLEPTSFSDAPNHPAFPDTILRPGVPYRQRTGFRFVPRAGGG